MPAPVNCVTLVLSIEAGRSGPAVRIGKATRVKLFGPGRMLPMHLLLLLVLHV